MSGQYPLTLDLKPGAEHCDDQNVQFLDVVFPVGSVVTTYDPSHVRQYVWDPEDTKHFRLAASPVRKATPPPDARDTGYRHGDLRLWIAESDADREVYIQHDDGTFELWPRAPMAITCS